MSAAPASSGVTAEELRAKLTEALEAVHVEIEDSSGGCGQSFSATIVSPLFSGKTRLARHRLVNSAVREEISRIHAWSARCLGVGEWEVEKGEVENGKVEKGEVEKGEVEKGEVEKGEVEKGEAEKREVEKRGVEE